MLARLRKTRRVVVIVALLISVCLPAASSVEIAVLSTGKEEAPGSFVTHVFAVTNDGVTADTYVLGFDAPPGWGILGAPGSITVGAGGEETLFVTLTIPPGTLAGEWEMILTATSQDDPAVTASSVALVVVTPTREIELLPPTGAAVVLGGSVEYEFILINRGNVQDSFSIEASSSKRLSVSVSPTVVDLAPQERATVCVRLNVPADTSPGRDALTITAMSMLYDQVEADGIVFTTVLPPGPESAGGTLMEVLPARVRLSFDKDVLGGEFSSGLTFSTSGRIKGGFFSSSVRLLDPLGPDRFELGSFSIVYRRSPITYTIGDVSQRLTDLIRLSCRGGAVIIDEELFDLSVIGGGSNDETRFAGRLALGPEVVNLGIDYLGIRDPAPTYKSVWGATASAEPLEDWTIHIEGALGTDGFLLSRAFFFNTQIDTSGFFFNGTAFSVGTQFPGSRPDSAGIEVSHRLNLTALSLSVSLQHVWDNVIHDPFATTLIRDDLGFNLATTPLKDGPTLRCTIDFAWDRYPDLGAKSEIGTLFAASMTETSGVFPYSFSGKLVDRIDHVLGTHVRRSTFSEGAGLSIDSFYVFLQVTQEKQVDVINDLLLSSSSDVLFRFRPEGSLHEAWVVFRNTLDAFALSASLYIRFVEGLDIAFDGSISWDRVDSNSVSFGWGISLNASVDIPIPFFVTKGQIEGRAFIDRDGDGTYGREDRPLGGIIVAADGGEVSTNEDGLFRFTPFYPGTYALTARQLPAGAAAGEPIDVHLVAGRSVWVEIPLTPVVVVTGTLFNDRDRNGMAEADEGGFAQVRALLSDEGGVVADAYTDLAGGFTFPNVMPGRYEITFDAGTLPDRFVFSTAERATIDVAADVPLPIVLGGSIRPREVVITVQPPTAAFVYTPEAPAAGEPIAFDGVFSSDLDGLIVLYEWDFDADGTADATEVVAEHTFAEPGVYDVSLTVVDDAGNRDTATLSIEVLGGSGAVSQPPSAASAQPPIANFGFMPASPTVGEPVRFDGSGSADFDGQIVTFEWDFDEDGTIDATGPIAERVFSGPGEHVVSLRVEDDSGNVDVLSLSIEIGTGFDVDSSGEPSAAPPVAGFQQSPTKPTAGDLVLFNGTSSIDPGGQIVEFAWDFDGDGQVDSTTPLAEHTFVEPGAYTVSLTVADNDGNVHTISRTITVQAPPPDAEDELLSFQPPVADFAYMPASPNPGDPVLFNGTFSSDFDGDIVSFAWDFDGDGTIDSADAIAEHAFTSPGTYSVSLTVTDDGGNTDTVTIPIDVE
jgi:PKD repeat protein